MRYLASSAGLLLLLAGVAAPRNAAAAPGDGPSSPLPTAGISSPVLGGTAVPEGRWRDTAAILFGGQQGCTGVLIAPTVVMTAAHCIDSELDAVLLGTNTLARPERGETIQVMRRVTYPGDKYDVAIVLLAQPSTIEPRRLATGWAQDEIVDGARVQFVGYGAIDSEGNTYVDELQEAESAITDSGCTRHAGCASVAQPDGEIGAGGGGIDTCFGDSGGPMYLLTAYGEFLTGITSRPYDDFMVPCSEGGIYTRPDKAEIVAWVEETAGITLPDGRGPQGALMVAAGESNDVLVDANDPRAAGAYTWEIVTPPAHGTATITTDGRLTVTAAADYLGPDHVVVRATDAADPTRSAKGTVAIEVVEELPEEEGGGCCSAGGGEERAAPALLVLGALLMRRRRRTIAR